MTCMSIVAASRELVCTIVFNPLGGRSSRPSFPWTSYDNAKGCRGLVTKRHEL